MIKRMIKASQKKIFILKLLSYQFNGLATLSHGNIEV